MSVRGSRLAEGVCAASAIVHAVSNEFRDIDARATRVGTLGAGSCRNVRGCSAIVLMVRVGPVLVYIKLPTEWERHIIRANLADFRMGGQVLLGRII